MAKRALGSSLKVFKRSGQGPDRGSVNQAIPKLFPRFCQQPVIIMRGGRTKGLGVLITLLVGLHQSEPAQADKLTLSPGAWSIRYSQGMPPNPFLAGSGWSFDFPRGTDCKKKHDCLGVHRSLCHHAISQADTRELGAHHQFSNHEARRGEI